MPAVSLGTRKTAFKELPFLHLSYQASALLTLLRISEGCLRFGNSAAPARTDPERNCDLQLSPHFSSIYILTPQLSALLLLLLLLLRLSLPSLTPSAPPPLTPTSGRALMSLLRQLPLIAENRRAFFAVLLKGQCAQNSVWVMRMHSVPPRPPRWPGKQQVALFCQACLQF